MHNDGNRWGPFSYISRSNVRVMTWDQVSGGLSNTPFSCEHASRQAGYRPVAFPSESRRA